MASVWKPSFRVTSGDSRFRQKKFSDRVDHHRLTTAGNILFYQRHLAMSCRIDVNLRIGGTYRRSGDFMDEEQRLVENDFLAQERRGKALVLTPKVSLPASTCDRVLLPEPLGP